MSDYGAVPIRNKASVENERPVKGKTKRPHHQHGVQAGTDDEEVSVHALGRVCPVVHVRDAPENLNAATIFEFLQLEFLQQIHGRSGGDIEVVQVFERQLWKLAQRESLVEEDLN